MPKQFYNLSCYEEFEIQCALAGISKIDILREIGHKVNDYYFFISEDGIFNWYNLNGNHVENPDVLKRLKEDHISKTITKCIIPDNITTIGDYAFFNCYSLTSINIPDNVTSIGYYAFSDCYSLKEITIHDSVTSIGIETFWCCESLKEINIPNSVKSIGKDAFFGCKSLKEIIFKGKTLDEVKRMDNYPFGIEDESIIKCEM